VTDCRVLVGPSADRRQFNGSGLVLPSGSVLTAEHVVRGKQPNELEAEVGGARAEVTAVTTCSAIDAALLHTSGPPATDTVSSTACAPGTRWIVTTRPRNNDPVLTGTVTAIDRAIVNARGNPVTALQLEVAEALEDFGGYSGSAVRLAERPEVVIGLLCEQVHSRHRSPAAGQPRATNVLYAVPIRRIIDEFELTIAEAPRPSDARPADGTVIRAARLIDAGELDEAERLLGSATHADLGVPAHWYLLARIAVARRNLGVAREYLNEALLLRPDDVPSISLLIKVLLLDNGGSARAEAKHLAESGHGLDARLDAWTECLALNRMFDPGIRSGTELDMLCPVPELMAYK
jgi:hypothetical protein